LVISRSLVSCYLRFLSPDSAAFKLGYKMVVSVGDDEIDFAQGEEYAEVISQAFGSIEGHPAPADLKRVRIRDIALPISSDHLTHVASEIKRLLKINNPWEELTLDVSDPRLYLAPFIDHPNFYPHPEIKNLTIVEGPRNTLGEDFKATIVEFAKMQHTAGVSLESVGFRTQGVLADVVERLQPWVGAVHIVAGGDVADG
jgi:hypothetical protein